MPRTAALLLLFASSLLAGGGPETTIVVVNGRSPASRRIANEYRKLRSIPASHLVVLDTVPDDAVISVPIFLDAIWRPIEKHLKERGLLESIDLVAYSAGFPYGVDFRKEYEALSGGKPAQDVGGIASLTGVTYLVRQVEAGAEFWSYRRPTNRYFRLGEAPKPSLSGEQTTLAMRAQQLQKSERRKEAREAYEQFLKDAPEFGRMWVAYASCLAEMGEVDAAFRALDQASARGFKQLGILTSSPSFARLRADARWAPMLESMQQAAPGLRPTLGFPAGGKFDPTGESDADADAEHRYFPAVQLAHTGFLGNSVPEVLAYLRAAAAADATSPDGTVYICKNGNVRSTAREAFFGPLMSALKARGRKVELLDKTTIPPGKQDVIGAVVGTAGFDWAKSGSTILPGAICDHLTSFGAHFGTASQTKLTEFLRYGAAGASGTVMEPLAIHLKFPNPMIHAFYADGCSLAEAFYQAVAAPYQLMIVGDGLCRPFAKPPAFELPVAAQPWKGKVAFEPQGDAHFEYWLDGVRVGNGPKYVLDADAPWHDFRVVAVAKDRIATRNSKLFERAWEPTAAAFGAEVPIRDADGVEVWYGTERVDRELHGKTSVPTQSIGPGPARLVVRRGGRAWHWDVTVTDPAPIEADVPAERVEPRLGLLARILDGDGEQTPLAEKWPERIVTSVAPRAAGLTVREQLAEFGKLRRVRLEGAIFAPQAGTYQVDGAAIQLRVGERELSAPRLGSSHLPVSLAPGWHRFELEYHRTHAFDLELLLGGAQPAAPARFARILPEVADLKVEKGKDGGYEVEFARVPRKKIVAFGVFPGKDAALPGEWTVEYRKSKRAKWVAAKDVRVLLAPATTRPAKDKKVLPLAAELVFAGEKRRYFRLTPKTPVEVESVRVSRVD